MKKNEERKKEKKKTSSQVSYDTKGKERSLWKWFQGLGRWMKVLLITIAGILSIIGFILAHVINSNPPQKSTQPYIAVVTSTKLPDFGLARDFEEGFKNKVKDYSDDDETWLRTAAGKIVRIEYINDFGKIENAKKRAQDILNNEKYIFFVGNSDSTLTAQTIDVFIKRPLSAPAMIIPIATAVEPIDRANDAKYVSFLRMPPNNKKQAEKIVEVAIKKAVLNQPVRAAIYADLTNPIYSVNLSRDIAENIREKGGAVLVEELIGITHSGLTHSFFTSMPIWHSKNPPNIIIYTGVFHHCKLLIDQISALEIKVPIIFSDGCMENKLLYYLDKTQLTNKAFLVLPVTVPGENKSKEIRKEDMPSFSIYGHDAVLLIKRILDHKDLKDYTRSAVADFVRTNRTQISFENGKAGKYGFNDKGENAMIEFSVYEVTGGNLKLCDLD